MKKVRELHEPLNSQERYLHGINLRLEALIHQVNSLVEHLASKEKVAVTKNETVEKVEEEKPVKRTRKRTAK